MNLMFLLFCIQNILRNSIQLFQIAVFRLSRVKMLVFLGVTSRFQLTFISFLHFISNQTESYALVYKQVACLGIFSNPRQKEEDDFCSSGIIWLDGKLVT